MSIGFNTSYNGANTPPWYISPTYVQVEPQPGEFSASALTPLFKLGNLTPDFTMSSVMPTFSIKNVTAQFEMSTFVDEISLQNLIPTE